MNQPGLLMPAWKTVNAHTTKYFYVDLCLVISNIGRHTPTLWDLLDYSLSLTTRPMLNLQVLFYTPFSSCLPFLRHGNCGMGAILLKANPSSTLLLQSVLTKWQTYELGQSC